MVTYILSNHILLVCLTILIIILNISHTYNGATLIQDETKVTKLTTPTHFVLVHGTCHGGWSWYKVRALLESAGHKVSSPDLGSAGIDPTDPNTMFTFQEYNKPIHDILTSLPPNEKVVIVGHSGGGLSVSEALQNFPEKILVGIYVVGQIQHNTSSHDGQEIVADSGPNDFDYFYGQGRENPPTSAIFKKEVQREKLYNKSPLEDSTLAAMLLKPCPMRAMRYITDDSIKAPRVFIRTLHDNFFPANKQSMVIKNWPPSDVYDIDSDHCPMFSNPSQLFDLLLKVGAKFSPSFMNFN